MPGPDWDAFAPSYRRQLWLERRALERLLELLAPGPQDRLLDLGTGTGELLAVLARRPVRPRAAIGIDSSKAMLARAADLPAVWTLERRDATSLPHPDASFDRVAAAYLLHVLDPPTRARVIAEAVRLLRPGGMLGTVTIAPPRSRIGRALSAPLRAAAARSRGRLAGLRPLDPAPELAAAGLSVVARARTFRGYPSLCVVAMSEPSAPG